MCSQLATVLCVKTIHICHGYIDVPRDIHSYIKYDLTDKEWYIQYNYMISTKRKIKILFSRQEYFSKVVSHFQIPNKGRNQLKKSANTV